MCKERVSLLCESVYGDEQLNTLQIRVSVDVSWNLIHHYSTDCITCTDNVSVPCVLLVSLQIDDREKLQQLYSTTISFHWSTCLVLLNQYCCLWFVDFLSLMYIHPVIFSCC